MESPIGRLWVAVTPRGLAWIDRREPLHASAVLDPVAAGAVVEELTAYFDGRLRDFSVPLDLRDAPGFDAAVWQAARSIPYGATVSYGELAALARYPRAARAAGGSMARCPLSPVVPCHRVIHADGSIGGWGTDTWVKRWLLDLERTGAAVASVHGQP
jgi:methylated-DNA-[protein]-cysteine S-methyltransferase